MTWLSLEFWRDVMQRTIEWAIAAIPKLLLVLLLTAVLLRIVRFACERVTTRALESEKYENATAAKEHEKRVQTLIDITRKAAVIGVWSLAAVLMLVQVGVNVAPILAGAGVLGLAVGFGAQELVRDVISGFFRLFDNQIRKGDVVMLNGTGGIVEKVGLRTTELRDLSGVLHVFQNGKVDSLGNMTKDWSAMVFDVGVAYKEDTDEVASVMCDVARGMQEDDEYGHKILEPLELFGVDSFGDNAVVIKARLKTVPIEQWSVGREYRRRLKQAFDERGIEIPFPHRTLYWGEASKPFRIDAHHSSSPDSAERPAEGRSA